MFFRFSDSVASWQTMEQRVRRTGSRGASAPLRSRPCARSLPVPLDANSASPHRPRRGTPRFALCAETDSTVEVSARRGIGSSGPGTDRLKEEVVLLLGSNVGRRVRRLRGGVAALAGEGEIRRISRIYAGEPSGRANQP